LNCHSPRQKEFDYQEDYVHEKAEGCKISWKNDKKNLTKSSEIAEQCNKSDYIFTASPRMGHEPVAARSLYLARCHHPVVL